MKDKDIPKTAFSTPNGKYEFVRLPFGLKNAPAIFQRMMNDVLRPLIGICCYVYIDDVIIFGKDAASHTENIEKVFKLLNEAGLKLNIEKSKFFQQEVNYLGHIVNRDGIKPDPEKVSAIKNIAVPTNLKDLKKFLGLVSYYRKFIKNCAELAKPLTLLTRGENARISANQSKKIQINLDKEALRSFDYLKTVLTSTEVLVFPDFSRPFILTTDASDFALGAVLSQGELGNDRPITFLSRSLNKTEEHYAPIEKEMLAIVWALDKLRNYLYGSKELKIVTDHEPLTGTLSNANHNAKLKRWKARIEEYNYTLIYRPGKSNVVADALSRLPPQETHELNTLTSSGTQHSAEEDSTDLIPHFELPINVFRNQLVFSKGKQMFCHEEPHKNYHRHYLRLPDFTEESLIELLKEYLNPSVTNGISMPEEYLNLLQKVFRENFSKIKARITQRRVIDVKNEENIMSIILNEHKRAHRNAEENKKQILEQFYFPQMMKNIKKVTRNCTICAENKYDRHPPRPELQPTPIPLYPTQILHIDIIEIKGEKFLTCIDKFSKFSKFFHIKNKSAIHFRDRLIKLLHYFSAPESIVMYNEGSFISPIVLNYFEGLGIDVYLTPSQKSEVNGAVERVHSTVIEIFRCHLQEYPDYSVKELTNIALDRYNNTVHSVTKRKPADVFFGRTARINYQNLTDFRDLVNSELKHEIERNQKLQLSRRNKKRSKPKNF